MRRILAWVVVGLLCAAPSASAWAEDALYGDQPSQRAVFVRFVNAMDVDVNIKSNLLPPTVLGTAAKDRVGPFAVIDRAGAASLEVTAKANGPEVRDTIPLKAGTAISVVVRSDNGVLQIKVFSSLFEMNPSRTILAFMNAAPACGNASLVLEPAHVVIFANIPVDEERARKINAVSAEIGATCGSLGSATANLERPEAGGAYSAWLMALSGRPALILHLDTFPVWHP